MHPLETGARLGADLVLLRPLGVGGEAVTWLARHRTHGTVVAKVVTRGASKERVARLEREYHLAAALDHPGVVPVFGFERGEADAWLVAEWVRGGDARRLRGEALPAVLRAILPVAAALEHAHSRGVVHRDLKASNVLIGEDGGGRLSDFGLAAALPGGPEVPALFGGGTPGAMSAQQLAGEAPHPADDVYALGGLLRDLLTGRPVTPGLAELVASMLAAGREDRPRLAEVRQALAAALERETTAPAPRRPRHDVVLAPPPRVEEVIAPAPLPGSLGAPPPGAEKSARRAAAVPGALSLAALGVAAVGVFVFLPRLVPRPSAGGAAALARPPLATPATSEPVPVRPVPAAAPAPDPDEPAEEPAAAVRAAPARTASRPAPAPTARPIDPAFSAAVSEGLAALERGAFAEARTAFQKAEAVEKGSAAVADGLTRAELGLRAEGLAAHQARGQAAEAREDWRAALAEYDAALALEPAVAFALAGRAGSLPRAELDEALEGYLKRPQRLAAEAVAREAETALDRARDTAGAGPRLARQVSALERLLAESRRPVPVTLLSDGLTAVVVQRVGALGTFRERAIELRPGTYVVLGTRRGYRDARHTLVVPRGKSPEPLVVRCHEAI